MTQAVTRVTPQSVTMTQQQLSPVPARTSSHRTLLRFITARKVIVGRALSHTALSPQQGRELHSGIHTRMIFHSEVAFCSLPQIVKASPPACAAIKTTSSTKAAMTVWFMLPPLKLRVTSGTAWKCATTSMEPDGSQAKSTLAYLHQANRVLIVSDAYKADGS